MAEEEIATNPEDPILYQDPDPVVRDTLLGKRRRWTTLGGWELAFLIVSILNIAACIGLSVTRLVQVVEVDKSSPDFTYTILMIINCGFCLFYVIHGVLKELRYEIYVLICATCVVFFYCIIEYNVNVTRRTDIKLGRLIVVSVMAPVNLALAIKVAYDFGWLEFRILGASQLMLDIYRRACWFLSLIKFDFQVAVSFLVLILKNGRDQIGLEIILVLSIGLSVSLLWCIFGAMLVKRESKWSAWIFALIGLAAPTFVLFKVVRAYVKYTSENSTMDEKMLLYSTLIIGALLLLIRSIVYIELVEVYRNFGKGLRRIAFDNEGGGSGLLTR